jgi:hypothetical protein
MNDAGFVLGALAVLWIVFGLGFAVGAWWRSLFERAAEE